jgi:hypothetical protein
MKLKIRAENDIQVLTISELDSPKNVDVLRAGITQIFRNGKNRIVLELAESKAVPSELLRELGRLKLLANELAGDIVISGLDEETKKRIDSFAKPPFAITFLTTPQALHYLKDMGVPRPPLPAQKPVAAPQAQPIPAAATAGPVPAIKEQFKEELRARELGEAGSLRKEVERLRSENESLMELLNKRMVERRDPPDVAAYRVRIAELEKQLSDILSQPPEKK